jgi:hypothetical protein
LLPASPNARNSHASLAAALAALLIAGTIALGAQPARSEASVQTPATADLVNALARELTDNFVMPDVGARYASMLTAKLASGAYAGISDPKALARTLTADLQAVSRDGHLQVFAPAPAAIGPGQHGGRPPLQPIIASGWLAAKVAYIDFGVFPGDADTLKQLDNFILAHADARVLIIDARHHHGGGIAEMDRLFAQMFTTETPLLTMDTRAAVVAREGGVPADGPWLRPAPGPDNVVRRVHVSRPAGRPAWAKTRVLLLTSRKTASAAEHMALALKRTRRATLVGEVTYGAGNFGGEVDLPGGFTAFVPVGRTFDPDTGKGWEGTGVAPDVAVPADAALDKALELAGVTPDQRWPFPKAQ